MRVPSLTNIEGNLRSPRAFALASVVVLIAGLIVTGWSWYVARQDVQLEYEAAFARSAEELEQNIDQRISNYEDILLGGVALFNASRDVGPDEWVSYVDTYDIGRRFPGTLGIGYTTLLRPGSVEQHEQTMRSLGYPDYSVQPKRAGGPESAIIYLEPRNRRNLEAIGFDMLSEKTRRAAMVEARDSGEITISGKVRLVQEIDDDVQAGFLIYAPVYKGEGEPDTVAERRKQIQGFVYAPLRAGDLLNGILSSEGRPGDISFRLYDGPEMTEDQLIYQSSDFERLSNSFSAERTEKRIELSNRTWTAEIYAPASLLQASQRQQPLVILFGGIITTVALAALVHFVTASRAKDLTFAKEREIQQAKDELLSLASHQLRTPATGVKQYIGMILEGYVGETSNDQDRLLQKAYQSNERQLEIINQILYVTRMDAGRIVLHKKQLDINRLIKDVLDEQQSIFKQRSHTVSTKLDRKKPTVPGDPQYIHMAVENLLTNASKYTPEGGQITVHTERDGEFLKISVSDTGVGIAEEDLHKLFQKFSRIDNDMSVIVGGSGIGLYLTNEIVKLHGGTIHVRTAHGEGSTFTITLPLNEEDQL